MKGFSGFPEGKLRLTSIPNLFFSELLPQIDTVAELKVSLYIFWALTQQDAAVRYLRLTDFLQDSVLMDGMGPTPTLAYEAVVDGLERAEARGTVLHVTVEGADGQIELYFLNSAKGRAAVEGIETGQWRPALGHDEPISLLIERPNIFVLYEQNIGSLTPLITEELRDAEQTYPAKWIEEAIGIAVRNNSRKWRYVLAILESWRLEGKDSGINRGNSQAKQSGHIPDEYKDIIER